MMLCQPTTKINATQLPQSIPQSPTRESFLRNEDINRILLIEHSDGSRRGVFREAKETKTKAPTELLIAHKKKVLIKLFMEANRNFLLLEGVLD